MLLLGKFLKLARQSLLTSTNTPALSGLKFVIGNQSGDLDSICSAISYAYYSHVYKLCSKKETSENVTTIPVLNFNRDELQLRKDAGWLLSEKLKSIDIADLVFINELNDLKMIESEKMKLILVDHNNPEKFIREKLKFKFDVVAIIDHHADEKLFVDGVSPRIIQPCGSCTTLVSNYWINDMQLLQKENVVEEFISFAELITLGCSALLIDTDELKFKAVDLDHEIFDNYYNIYNDVLIRSNEECIDFANLFKILREKKNNIDDLTVGEILSKDYKSYDLIRKQENNQVYYTGISSMVKSFNWMINRDGEEHVMNAIEQFRDKQGLDICIIMTSYIDEASGNFSREMIVLVKENSFGFIIHDLMASILDLKRLDDGKNPKYAAFQQQNTKASRKQVVPILREIMEAS